MKLQAGDRIWINDSDFIDVILQIYHDFEEYGLCIPLWVDQICWEHNVNNIVSFLAKPEYYDNNLNVEEHIIEQLYCEEAFPWQ